MGAGKVWLQSVLRTWPHFESQNQQKKTKQQRLNQQKQGPFCLQDPVQA
jgi:hypothetical protein